MSLVTAIGVTIFITNTVNHRTCVKITHLTYVHHGHGTAADHLLRRSPKKPKEYAALRTRHSDEGMSTRAIAPIVGASKDTVHRDLTGVANETPEPAHVERTVIAEQRHVTVASDRKSAVETSTPEPWPSEPQLKPCSNFMGSRKVELQPIG